MYNTVKVFLINSPFAYILPNTYLLIIEEHACYAICSFRNGVFLVFLNSFYCMHACELLQNDAYTQRSATQMYAYLAHARRRPRYR